MSGAKPGERRGGRKPGVPNKATTEIRALAREHGPEALRELARLAKEAKTDQARIAACNSLLDRAYGRSQASSLIDIELPDVNTTEGITKSLAVVLNATATGKITPAEAHALSSVIETQRKAIETVELEARIKLLEQGTERAGR
jgi:hypothetical protein